MQTHKHTHAQLYFSLTLICSQDLCFILAVGQHFLFILTHARGMCTPLFCFFLHCDYKFYVPCLLFARHFLFIVTQAPLPLYFSLCYTHRFCVPCLLLVRHFLFNVIHARTSGTNCNVSVYQRDETTCYFVCVSHHL